MSAKDQSIEGALEEQLHSTSKALVDAELEE
jgi:hypothetical protein